MGLAFALAASRLPHVEVTLIERHAVGVIPTGQWDHRVYALSPQSVGFLSSLGVWQKIPAARFAPIDTMQIYSAADANVDTPAINLSQGTPLAHMVEHQTLMAALLSALAESNVAVMEQDGVDALSAVDEKQPTRHITLKSGKALDAHLLIGADGRASATRRLAGVDVIEKDYASTALVANFRSEKPHGHVARQWFHGHDVLAWLPLPDKQISIVWSVTHNEAARLQSLDDAALAMVVAAAGGHALGKLSLCSARETFTLKRILACQWVQPGFALMGDAAHALHPLAGQGMNLGFGDAQCLCAVLAARSMLSGIGDEAVLRRYARKRAEPTVLMAETTDHLQSLFGRDDSVAKWLRGSGFSWFARTPVIKRMATNYAAQA